MSRRGDPPRSDRTPPGRIEPWFDSDAMLHTPPPGGEPRGVPPRRATRRPERRRFPWVLVVAAVLLAALLFLLRPWLSDWLWPETRAQQLRQQAALALQAGRLTASDGSGARELYEAALALEPDRAEAQAGLARVGRAALDRAHAAMEQRRYPQAHDALRLARELDVPQARVDALGEQLRQREAADAGLGQLLQRAAAAHRAGRLDGSPDAALPLYQRVLELRPGQTVALEGREDVLNDLLRLAGQALGRGELGKASALVKRVRNADAGHVGLPEAIAGLAEHVARRHQQAAADLEAGRLDDALAHYRALLVADPDDAEAARGHERVALAHARRSQRVASDFRFDEADAELERAMAIAPGNPEVAAAGRHLDRMRRSYTRLRGNLSDPQRAQRVTQLLAQAAAAEERGDLLAPPGESMYDRLRAARALAPDDPRVSAASARLLPAVRRCYDESLRGNDLGRAGSCLDALSALGGQPEVLRDLRRRLAQRWIAVGDQWLGDGRAADARRALQSARSQDPTAPGLAEFAARVQAASPAIEP